MKISTFQNRLKNSKPILMDGAMGTEILRRGMKTTLPLWSAQALLTHPELIQKIHEDYIKAGAQILITNTFRTTARAFAKSGLSSRRASETARLACRLAINAVTKAKPAHRVYIAGSIAPLEDCYLPELTPSVKELEKEHLQYVKDLKEGGADFILLETMITLGETEAGLKAAQKLKMSAAVSFCVNKNLDLLGGETLRQAVLLAEKYNLLFIGVNCVSPDIATSAVRKLKKLSNLSLCVYAQGDGKPENTQGWEFVKENGIDNYLRHTKKWIKSGVKIIGGCCGTTPLYIKRINKLFSFI